MKYKALIVGVALSAQICMGNPFVFAELFGDYVFYAGFPAGTYPDKNGNPLNYRGRSQGLVKINEGSKDEATLYEGNYNDGKKEGLFTLKSTVYEGVVFKEENYKDDQLNGEKKVWNFIPKANATAKEYRILVEKTLYEQGEVTAKKTLPNGESREIREVIERKKVDLATFYKKHDGAFNSSMNENRKIVREPGCGVIVLDKKENEQGNKHSYSIAISNKHTIKNMNDEWVWDKDSKDYACSSQYGFFETLLESFDSKKFKPFANDSDYQAQKPSVENDSGNTVIYLPNSVIKETITETINGATYKLNFGRLGSWKVGSRESQYHSIRFTKNNTDIDPHVYDKEVFDKLVGKMYDKEVSSFINENFDKLKINYY